MTLQDRTALRYAIIVVIGGLVFGLDAGVIGGAVKYIKAEFDLTPLQVGTVVGAPAFGANFALLCVGWIVATLGRKRTLLLIAFFYLASSIFSAFATSYYMLVFGRLLAGLAFTSLGISSMYIGEVAPAKNRGKFMSSMQFMIGIGFFVAYLLDYLIVDLRPEDPAMISSSFVFSNSHIWRFMFASTIIPCFLWFIFLFTVSESPRWLIQKKREDEALKVIKKIENPDNVQSVLAEIHDSLDKVTKLGIFDQLRALFTKRMKIVLILGFGLAITQACAGMGVISYYAPSIFEQIGFSETSALFQATIVGLLGIVGSGVAVIVVDKFGRRPIYIFGAVVILVVHSTMWLSLKTETYTVTDDGIAKMQMIKGNADMDLTPLKNAIGTVYKSDVEFKTFLESQYDKKYLNLNENKFVSAFVHFAISPTIIVGAIFLFKFAFFLSVGPLMWVIFSEVMPNAVRSVSIPLFGFVTSVLAWATQKYFPWEVATLGISNTFLLYAILAVVSLIFIFIFVPETKNKTIEQIEHDLVKE